jgi:hypothetical protein
MVEIILEKGDCALIKRGNNVKEYAVVRGLDKKNCTWGHTIAYYGYEFEGKKTENDEAEQLTKALDCFRCHTEDNYIHRSRLEELATLFKDGLMEDDEENAMEYFEETCEMTDAEKKYFGIESEEE